MATGPSFDVTNWLKGSSQATWRTLAATVVFRIFLGMLRTRSARREELLGDGCDGEK